MSAVHFTTSDEFDDPAHALALCGIALVGEDKTWGPESTDQSDNVTCSACQTLLDDAGGDVTPDDDDDDDDDDDAPLDAMDELVAEELADDE